MRITVDQALTNAINLLELVDMTSDWYVEAAESAKVLHGLQSSFKLRRGKK
jgi:hypothetical protein